jgi:hypothetical protein
MKISASVDHHGSKQAAVAIVPARYCYAACCRCEPHGHLRENTCDLKFVCQQSFTFDSRRPRFAAAITLAKTWETPS